jgi:hypothetical protein
MTRLVIADHLGTGILLAAFVTFSLMLGFAPFGYAATPTATMTLNQSEFRAGDTLTVGLQVTNPADGPPANLYLGVVMPEGETALSIIPSGNTLPVFRKPFDGDFELRNWFDHDLPFEFIDTSTTIRFWGLNRPVWDNVAECIQLVNPSGGRYRIATVSGACN